MNVRRNKKVSVYEQGFALVVVLITLLILSGLVASLLQNQTLSLKETANFFAASELEQNSHDVHRACLSEVRAKLSHSIYGNNVTPAAVSWVMDKGNGFTVSVNGVQRLCNLQLVDLPDGKLDWTPVLKISSMFDRYTEVSEWRYTPCNEKEIATCTYADVNISVKNDRGAEQVVRPAFLANSVVQTVWQRN